LTLEAAAGRLGLSTRTVRRRVLAGTLPYEREATPQGYRYWVLVEQDGDAATPVVPSPAPSTETAALLAQVQGERDWLRQHAEEQAQTIVRLTRQAEAYQVLLGQAQAALHQLAPAAEDGQMASHQVGSGSQVDSQKVSTQVDTPCPWWRRWLGWP
jgi:hypothetical protein